MSRSRMHVTIYVDAEAAFMCAVAALGRDGNRTEAISRLLLWCAAQTKGND